MKRYLFVLALFCSMAVPAYASVPVVGKGDAMRFDSSRFPGQMKANHGILEEKCTKCHSLERVVIPFVTGVTPITGQQFDMNAMKATLFTMVRKANTKSIAISKDEAKAVSTLLKHLLDESAR